METVKLGDVVDLKWGDTNTTKKSYVESGYVAYSASGPDGYLPHADYDETGIVLSAIGSHCGGTWLAEGKWSCIKNTIRILGNNKKADIRYVYWATKTPNFWPRRGSGQPFISQGDARNCEIMLPARDVQVAIVETLQSFDDKIDLNRRMNATLEAQARALFRDWFVDFGPTRAKMAGATPYLPADLWALFPNALGEDGLPEGWREMPLDTVADFINGAAMQKHPASDGEDFLPVIKIAELRNGVTPKSNKATTDIPSKYLVEDGDFLFSWSGSLLAKYWTGGPGALNQHLFKVTSETHPMWFASLWTQHHLAEFQRIAASKATTMGHIKRIHLSQAMTVCPPDQSLKALGRHIAPMIKKQIDNELESKSLAEARDYLLPLLMSGEMKA